MKDFEEFRLEAFNNILPLVKEVVDDFFYVQHLESILNEHDVKLIKIQNDKRALEKICISNDELSEDTNYEIKCMLERRKKEITDIENLIEEENTAIDDLESTIMDYNKYFAGVGDGIMKVVGKLLKNAEDVKIEYLREYFYLMFFLRKKPIPCYKFSIENLLSEEAIEYICKYLLENEEEDVANRKIAVLRGNETLHQKEFFELFK